MTDQAEAGSVQEQQVPAAGTPATPTPPAENGSAAVGAESPFSGLQLDEDTRKWVETKGYKTVEDVIASGRNAETKLGSSVTVPAADAPQEEWAKFYERLPESMRPIASPDKMEFKRPEGLPEDLPYSQELADQARNWAHEAKLSPGQAQVIHDKYAQFQAAQAQAFQQQVAKSVETTHDELVKEWGPQDSEGFKKNHQLADRAMKGLGLVDAYKSAGILLPDGALTNSQIAKAFATIGEKMFAEDTIGNTASAGGGNPFKKDASGNRNMTAISLLVKTDPQRARTLAIDAGENPDAWMRSNPL